jgi:DNA-directed RNA polymerase beta subunit
MRIEAMQGIDELGEVEELSHDLFPIVDGSETSHLGEFGLPKPGTIIKPGMIIIGKIGKTLHYRDDFQPNVLEIHAWTTDELRAKYGHTWKNTSVYATPGMEGVVSNAYLEQTPLGTRAVVEIDPL